MPGAGCVCRRRFEPREVTLVQTATDYIPVITGLAAGDEVVILAHALHSRLNKLQRFWRESLVMV